MKKVIYIILVLIVLWVAMFITDNAMVNSDRAPIFTIKGDILKDGGSTSYTGLGYKVHKYVSLIEREDGINEMYVIGPWSMKWENPFDEEVEKVVDPEELEKQRQELLDKEYEKEMESVIGKEISFEKQMIHEYIDFEEIQANEGKFIIHNKMELDAFLKPYLEEDVNNRSEGVFDKYDEEFFKENALIIYMTVESSGSIGRDIIKAVRKDLNTIELTLESNVPEVGTMDMSGWTIILEVKQSDLLSVIDVEIVEE